MGIFDFFKKCDCRREHFNFGEYQNAVKNFERMRIIGTVAWNVVARCSKCGSYQLFNSSLSLDWEAIEFDRILDKARKEKPTLEEFRKELVCALKGSKRWEVGDIVIYENGEKK